MNPEYTSQRGSVLFTALILAAILATTILLTFIPMTTTTLKMSQRAFLTSDAVNLAEAGLELGLWSFNQTVQGSTTAWNSPWANSTLSSNDKTRTFTGFTLSQGAKGSVKVYVKNYNSSAIPPAPTPVIYAEAIVQPANGPAIIKVVKTELARRSLFGRGGVALNGFVFKGTNPMADSWNSKYDDSNVLRATRANYAGGNQLATPTAGANNHDKVTLAAVNVNASFSGQNADIWGSVSIAADANNGYVTVGPQGRIGPFGTPLGQIDSNAVNYNFTMDLPAAAAPTGVTYNYKSSVSSTVTYPEAGDVATLNSDGTYTYYYSIPGITLTGNAANSQLNVAANTNVAIVSTSAVTVGSNGVITVNTGGTLALYSSSDITITGAIANIDGSAFSGSMQIWGTNSTAGAQTIKLSGNGTLSAVAYAPNAYIEVKGGGSGSSNGDIYGSFVGYKVTFTGNDSFHWDESLSDLTAGGTYMPSKWRELISATDRGISTDPGYSSTAMYYLSSF